MSVHPPGWYPDPTGQPHTVRWWDGSAWTSQLASVDGVQPGAGEQRAFNTPSGNGARRPPEGAKQASGAPGRGTSGRWVALALAVVMLTVVLWHPWNRGDDTPSAGDEPAATVSGWDETSTTSPSALPSDEAAPGAPTSCPMVAADEGESVVTAGRIHGGGLSFEAVPGWDSDIGQMVSWGHDVHGQQALVADGWIALVAVGELRAGEGFTGAQPSARQAWECMASSEYYPARTGTRVVWSRATTVSGRAAWWVRGEVTVFGRDVPGDVIDSIVVDLGGGRLAFCATQAAIGQPETQAIVDRAVASLQVA